MPVDIGLNSRVVEVLKSFTAYRTANLSIAHLEGKSNSLILVERARCLRSLLVVAEKIEIRYSLS